MIPQPSLNKELLSRILFSELESFSPHPMLGGFEQHTGATVSAT
jgi:hypothetical protein